MPVPYWLFQSVQVYSSVLMNVLRWWIGYRSQYVDLFAYDGWFSPCIKMQIFSGLIVLLSWPYCLFRMYY